MYAWATPEYMLKHMSIEQIFMYYDYGVEFEENKANILVNRIAVGFFGVKEEPKKQKRDYNDTPDKTSFYERYGDKIKRPEGVRE
ncbi:hypothetical protein KHA94_16250 [Bacillus sp. FJAT-49705]|uniref:Uncharacterized protein n=1 Tax=Cytobacillus citreus TaxID=2833586 RepID=A0ABS5NV90_9BACI|nr:hypothetical protein [Cytobacillus citreus]MBS4191742.1 hypothetical protein [Cytobacillus citreus]